ncbi:MAG: ribonuclease III [Lachnospiraceae bacterium]|nr:ribonuclease III [Lachnospiraceae bacterium]
MFLLEELEEKIGYCFQDKSLLRQALTHSSFSNEQKINKWKNYERIEYLGDAVLELISSDYFYHTYPEETEGNLTKMRASAVCEQALAITARELQLGGYMIFGKGEEQNGGRERESIIADAVEAIIGAIYLDGGLEQAKKFIHGFVLNDLDHKRLFYDAKSILQERIQEAKLGELTYELIREEGPEHEKNFVMEARLNGETIGTGQGKSKKTAQQHAAYDALLKQNGTER